MHINPGPGNNVMYNLDFCNEKRLSVNSDVDRPNKGTRKERKMERKGRTNYDATFTVGECHKNAATDRPTDRPTTNQSTNNPCDLESNK